MVEYRRIKTLDGLKKDPTPNKGEKIPETFAAVKMHDDEDVTVTVTPQSALTSDCWLVQFNGFESCTDCGVHLGKECGGGATLAKMIIDHFSDSVMTKMRFNEYWGNDTEEEDKSFFNYVEWTKTHYSFEYSFKKYKRHVKQLQQIATERIGLDLDNLYPFAAHFKQPDNKITDESGYHQSNACNCAFTTQKGSYRDVTIEYTPKDGPDTITLHYYHQHCIMRRIGNTVWLNSAGYRTITTKERINSYLRNWTLQQDRFKWYLKQYGNDERISFYDGISIPDVSGRSRNG